MATSVYVATMVIVLTITMISSILNLRKELQLIYFSYLSALNKDTGFNFLRLRTVLIQGLGGLNMQDEELKEILNNIASSNEIYGDLIEAVNLQDYRKQLDIIAKKKTLEFYRNLKLERNLSSLSEKWLGEEVRNADDYEKEIVKFETRLEQLRDDPNNSGYAFVCFNTFAAIKELKNYFKKVKASPKRYQEHKNLKNIRIEPFVDVIDINWQNCFYKPKYRLSKIMWTIVIWFILIFFTTPTVN